MNSSIVMTAAAQRRRSVRKFVNAVALTLSGLATAIGLFFLGAILFTLLKNGFAGVSGALFTENTPPPGDSGGLLNAIYGSVVMTLIGILIGAPIGMLAGTYLAEYGRSSRLSSDAHCRNSLAAFEARMIVS